MTTDDDVILVDCTSGAVTITLPAAASTALTGNANKVWQIKKIDSTANAVTIAGTIDGFTNYHLVRQYETVDIISNGTALYQTSTELVPKSHTSEWFTIEEIKPSGSPSALAKFSGSTDSGSFRSLLQTF